MGDMAKLIVFEGGDKAGKETQSKLLTNVLKAEGFRATRAEPAKEGHPRARKLIYSMLESGAAKRWPNTFQFVQFINRMYFQAFKLPKLLRNNDIVILDRWALSGYVYGSCEGINDSLNHWMYNRAKQADVVIVQSGTSYKRSSMADDSYEKDSYLQTCVKIMYRNIGMSWPRHALVDNHDSIMDVHHSIRAFLENDGIVPSTRCPVCKVAYNEPCQEAYHR
jgi:thymidylate kinase